MKSRTKLFLCWKCHAPLIRLLEIPMRLEGEIVCGRCAVDNLIRFDGTSRAGRSLLVED